VLLGRGTPIKADSANLDTIRIGKTAQTLALISNRGGVSTRVIIDSAMILGSTNGFAVNSPRSSLYINSGASSSVVVTCTPINEGNISATIRYFARFIQTTSQGETVFYDTLTTKVKAFARNARPGRDIPVTVGIRPARGQESLAPGASVTMELFIEKVDDADGNGAGISTILQNLPLSYSTIIRFNRQALALGTNPATLKAISNPDPSNNVQRVSITSATITTRNISALLRDSVLLRFSCIAVAGETTQTAIELEYFRFAVDTLPTTLLPTPFLGERVIFVEGLRAGSFTAKVSRAGGTRLIGRAGTSATLSAMQPNPVLDVGHITYSVLEPTLAQVVLVDVFGRVMKVLADGDHAKGEFIASVPVSDLPSGTYFVVLRTPAILLTERVQVQR